MGDGGTATVFGILLGNRGVGKRKREREKMGMGENMGEQMLLLL